MKQAASIYFTTTGYVVCNPDGEPTSLMTIDASDLTLEQRLQRAWYYLGKGIADVLSDGYEFVELLSDTKVIDQLDGVVIEDEDCLAMAHSIRSKGLPQLLHYELKKVTTEKIEVIFNEAEKELRG